MQTWQPSEACLQKTILQCKKQALDHTTCGSHQKKIFCNLQNISTTVQLFLCCQKGQNCLRLTDLHFWVPASLKFWKEPLIVFATNCFYLIEPLVQVWSISLLSYWTSDSSVFPTKKHLIQFWTGSEVCFHIFCT